MDKPYTYKLPCLHLTRLRMFGSRNSIGICTFAKSNPTYATHFKGGLVTQIALNIRMRSLATLWQRELSKYLSASRLMSRSTLMRCPYPTSQVQNSGRFLLEMYERGSILQKTDKLIVECLATKFSVVRNNIRITHVSNISLL